MVRELHAGEVASGSGRHRRSHQDLHVVGKDLRNILNSIYVLKTMIVFFPKKYA